MRQRKPLIAITNDSNCFQTPPAPTRAIVCPAVYANTVAAAGGVPVITAEQCPEELAGYCDGLLLSGGGDVSPALYGETPRFPSVRFDEARDAFEVAMARAFFAAGKPVFGICRGSQLLNVVLGGTLYQDLPEELGFIHFDRDLRHFVQTEEGSVLRVLFGERFRVNSTHHQAVRTLAPGLRATAFSPEGILEGFEHDSLPIWGCQFHPERLVCLTDDHRTPDFLPLFERFVTLCRTMERGDDV